MPQVTSWSHNYFTKQDDGEFQCNFGCGSKYVEDAARMENHLLNQYKKIGFEACTKINKKAGIKEGTPTKRPKLIDLLKTSTSSTPTTSKAMTLCGISSVLNRVSGNEQEQMDRLLTKVLIAGNVAANFLDNPFFQ